MDLRTYLDKSGVTQSALARRVGVTPGMVWQWINGIRPISAEQVLPIESATDGNVSRYDLRPDIYPPPSEAA